MWTMVIFVFTVLHGYVHTQRTRFFCPEVAMRAREIRRHDAKKVCICIKNMKTNKIYCSLFYVVQFLIKIIYLGNIVRSKTTHLPQYFFES